MEPMRTVARRLMPVAVASGLAVAAWLGVFRFSTHTVIDGYPIGRATSCGDECQRLTDAAAAWLDTAAPGHAKVDRIDLFEPDYRDASGHLLLTSGSGGPTSIAVFYLANGTVRAIEVGCGVGIEPDQCFTKQPMTPAG
jgi:hypothetical protein